MDTTDESGATTVELVGYMGMTVPDHTHSRPVFQNVGNLALSGNPDLAVIDSPIR